MRISEAIEKSYRKLAWRPYYTDLSLMEDESVAKAIYAAGEDGPFTLHWEESGNYICELASHDYGKTRGLDDWRSVDPIRPETEYSKEEAVSTIALELEKVRHSLPELYEDILMFGSPSSTGTYEGLERSELPKVSARGIRIPIKTTSTPDLEVHIIDEHCPEGMLHPITADSLRITAERLKKALGVDTVRECYGGIPAIIKWEPKDTGKAILYEWESSSLRASAKHKAKPSKSKMRVPFYRFRK